MATTKLRRLPKGLVLQEGAHAPDGQFCVMEAVAWVAREPWSDHPQCACPVLSSFLRMWNDALNDEDRQILVPYVTKLVDTRSTPAVEKQRQKIMWDWVLRVYVPTWLRLAKLDDHADAVEKQGEKALAAAWAAAGDAAGDAARAAAWAAARASAGDAARAAARGADAAWAAAGAAARAAARDAAWAAAGDASGAAAWAAAGDAAAAGGAARDAARAALRPTVVELQRSALLMLDECIAVVAA